MAAGRVFGILVEAIDFGLGVVGLKFPAKHLDIRRVGMESVRSRVHPNKGFARFDPFNERILVGQRQFAGSIGKDDAIVIFQRCRGHFLSHIFVIPHVIHSVSAAFLGQFTQHLFGRRDRAVAESFRDGHNQQLLGRCQPG